MSAFDFIAEAWPELDAWFEAVRRLPPTRAAFTERYGSLDDAADAEETIAALLTTTELAERIGNAAAVKREIAANPGFLTSDTTPQMLYGRLVRWAMLVQNAVSSATAQLAELTAATTASGPAGGITAADVRSALSDSVASTLRHAVQEGRDLAAAFGNVRDRLLPQVEVIAGSSTVRLASRSIRQAQARRGELRDQAAQHYRDWKHLSLQPSGQLPTLEVAKATAPGRTWWPFGRDKERAAEAGYAATLQALAAVDAEEAAKTRYVAEVGGLDRGGTQAAPALDRLTHGINAVATELDRVAGRAEDVARSANDEQLLDASWLTGAVDLERIAGLDQDAAAFVEVALVDSPRTAS